MPQMKAKVIYYIDSRGRNPVEKFISTLPENAQAKILRVLRHLEEYGAISVIPHVKKAVGTKLWEIRILGKDNIRVLYIVPEKDTILVLHGFKKKTQKTPRKELRKAQDRYEDWILRRKAN